VSSEVGNDGTAMGQPMCTLTPAPCGGDFVGEWTMEATCGYEVLPNYFEEVCAGSTQQVTGSSISGTRTFNDDNTFTFDAIVQLEADLQVDSMACAGVDCVTFGEALSDEPGIEMVCEDGNGTSCNCIYTADIPHMSTGTWNLYNDAILLTSEDGEVIGLQEYCVEGGRFTTWSPLYQGTAFPDTSCAADDDCEGQVVGEFDGIGCDPPEDAG